MRPFLSVNKMYLIDYNNESHNTRIGHRLISLLQHMLTKSGGGQHVCSHLYRVTSHLGVMRKGGQNCSMAVPMVSISGRPLATASCSKRRHFQRPVHCRKFQNLSRLLVWYIHTKQLNMFLTQSLQYTPR